jgi:adenine-specific DNA-methyltransferase
MPQKHRTTGMSGRNPIMADIGENEAFLTRQLITCIGNKRSLLGFIGEALEKVKLRLGKRRLRLIDLFSGSGAVSRLFKQHAELLLVNDIEVYSEIISRCYLANPSTLPLRELDSLHGELTRRLREEPLRRGFIAELYAPADEKNIGEGERVFYTPRNARFIDTARQYIEEIDAGLRPFFTAPLLSEASVHANTAGVFKGFYKDPETGRGHFGGKGSEALSRIKGEITLPFPVWSRFECPVEIYREDANALARRLPELDVAYLDPPYNQHPYGSNYFMLNLICSYRQPEKISPVSGIPPDWNRSDYNKPGRALGALAELAAALPAKFLLISFNSEGFIGRTEMEQILKKTGQVEVLEISYNVFRGSRNLKNRGIHVKEYLFIVEKR